MLEVPKRDAVSINYNMSMITSTAWVPRGFAAPFPTRYNFDEEEFKRIANLAKLQLDEAQEDLIEAEKNAHSNDKDAPTKERKAPSTKLNASDGYVPRTSHFIIRTLSLTL